MPSLIIKVSYKGMSQEFLFNRPGPISIGQDGNCDLCLKEYPIGKNAFELKLSGEKIFIKEVGALNKASLNSVLIPRDEEILYKEGSNLSFGNVVFHIKRANESSSDIEPPPFSLEESKDRLKKIEVQIRESRSLVTRLSESKEKKRNELLKIEEDLKFGQKEKNKLELEVGSLLTRKDLLVREINEIQENSIKESEGISKLQEFIKRLQLEERDLKEAISSQTILLTNLKDDREKKSKEIDKKRNELINLETEEVKLKRTLKELEQTLNQHRREILEEEERIKEILLKSDDALKEHKKIEHELSYKFKEKTILDEDLVSKQDELRRLEIQRTDATTKLNELRLVLGEEEDQLYKTKSFVQDQRKEEERLKKLNAELRIELSRAEEKISFKQDQLNNLDFKNEDATRKLASINYELERTSIRLDEFSREEKTQELKIEALRIDMDNLLRKFSDDKKRIEDELDEEKIKFSHALKHQEKNILEKSRELEEKVSKYEEIKVLLEEVKFEHRSLQKEKNLVQKELEEFKVQKSATQKRLEFLKEEVSKIENSKASLEREITSLEIRVLDVENKILEDQEKAKLEIESFKRDARQKIASEKEVSLNEVEAYKQKAINQVEEEHRKKQEEISKIKEIAESKASEIIKEARDVEKELTNEAQKRLREITQDVQERERFSHLRVEEAQAYLKEKEKEAEAIIVKAKLESRELARRAEEELLEELSERKVKIKKFLSHKQNTGIAHLNRLREGHVAKMKRNEILGLQKIEAAKKKELKKIAKLCADEFEKQKAIRDKAMSEINADKMKKVHEVNQMRSQQEKELQEKKKTMLEHINAMKFEQTKIWQSELQREKDAFRKTKKDRINNATQAVMNILIAEMDNLSEKEEFLRSKVKQKLEMAIDGQDATALSEVDQVLDFSPEKRKKIVPVLKKYTFKIAMPIAAALAIVFDVGSIRTSSVNGVKELLRQQESASEIYVEQQKNEWREKNTFNPETTVGFKETFMDNILYTTDFAKVVEDESFQNDWILQVNDFMVNKLELSEDIVISYISSEGALIQELSLARNDLHPKFLDKGFKKMQEMEEKHLGWLAEKVNDSDKLSRFKEFRKEYFDNYYATNFSNPDRAIASEVTPPEETPQVE